MKACTKQMFSRAEVPNETGCQYFKSHDVVKSLPSLRRYMGEYKKLEINNYKEEQ